MRDTLEAYIRETLTAFSQERGITLEKEQQASIVRHITDSFDSESSSNK